MITRSSTLPSRFGLSRAAFAASQSSAPGGIPLPISTPTPRTFFTSSPKCNDNTKNNDDDNEPVFFTPASPRFRTSSQARSALAASHLSAMAGEPRAPPPIRTAPRAPAGTTPIDPARIISLRSLRGQSGTIRGGLHGRGLRVRRALGAGSGGFIAEARGGVPGKGQRGTPSSRFVAVRMPGSLGGSLLGGGRGRGRGRGRFASGARRARRKPKDVDNAADEKEGKVEWTADEQRYFDGVEQGVPVAYEPRLTTEDLQGYGPAIASGAARAQVETALRSLRVLGGGMAFTTEGCMADAEATRLKLARREPVFFASEEERRYLVRQAGLRDHQVPGAKKATRKAIERVALLGQADKKTPEWVSHEYPLDLAEVYQAKNPTYKVGDVRAFAATVERLIRGNRVQGRRPEVES